jgi:hypothetical protein
MLGAGKECQASLINYRKGGTPFINLVTIVPIPWDSDEIVYHVGFQVDLVEQPNAILRNMRDGSYQVNYTVVNNPQPSLKPPPVKTIVEPPSVKTIGLKQELLDLIGPTRAHAAAVIGGEDAGKAEWLKFVLEETDGKLYRNPCQKHWLTLFNRLCACIVPERTVPLRVSECPSSPGV